MASTTRSVFRNSALLSGLITQEELDRVESLVRETIEGLEGSLAEVTDRELAAKLIEMGVITDYQADQLRSGRTKFNLGPYIITDWIGQGGMGHVFKAEHQVMGRQCAVKVLPLNKSNPESIANFRREIRAQAKIGHPNLVHAYDAGNDRDVHYLVTEYVPGTDLRRLIRNEGPLTMQQAASVISQAALGLQHAHECGLIHRDVKPGNILVTPDGVAKVSDLGLAGFMNEEENDPRAGKIVGTADYLAPEQIKNPHEVLKVSDIYALGCTLYYAVTGKVPFPGGTPSSKARRHLEETPWHPRRFNVDASEEFVEVIADMMEKDPEDRLPTAAEVAARLEPWASDAAPIPTQQLTRARWAAAPLPTGSEEAQQTHGSSGEVDEPSSSQSAVGLGQASQVTDPLSGHTTDSAEAPQELPVPPPLPSGARRDAPGTEALAALPLAVTIALILGVILGFMIRGWM